MKVDRYMLTLAVVMILSSVVMGQTSSFADSLQIKVYSLIYVNRQFKVDSISVSKIFCDYCSQTQREFVKMQASGLTRKRYLRQDYDKAGVYRNVLYLRYSKQEFRKLNDQ
jgi:hypothetical protein